MNTNIDLRRTVLDELEWEPSINADEIAATVHEGIVTLTGSVPSYAEKLKAEQVVKLARRQSDCQRHRSSLAQPSCQSRLRNCRGRRERPQVEKLGAGR